MSGLLEIDRLDVDIASRRVCHRLSLALENDQAWALLGPNGSGKTTLLHTLAGLRRPTAGQLHIQDQALATMKPGARARRIALLLQHSSRGFGASVLETVLDGRHPHLGALSWEGAADLAIAEQAMADLGLQALAGRPLTTLSGGELRRVEIARLLTQQAPLSLLDEPLNHLDLAHQATCLQVLLARCRSPNRGLMLVLHDLNHAYQACDHWLLLLGDGEWAAGPRGELADPSLLRRAFGPELEMIDGPDGPLFVTRLHQAR